VAEEEWVGVWAVLLIVFVSGIGRVMVKEYGYIGLDSRFGSQIYSIGFFMKIFKRKY
jgi:hypothetical protein